jgi:hypothetical protein
MFSYKSLKEKEKSKWGETQQGCTKMVITGQSICCIICNAVYALLSSNGLSRNL